MEEAPLGANTGFERANNDSAYTPRNSYAFSSSSKIPVQTSSLTGMNDTSPLLSPSEHKLPAETRYIEEEMPRITLDQLGGITVPPPEYQSTYDSIKSQHSRGHNSYNEDEDARLDSFNEAVKSGDGTNKLLLQLTDTISKHVAYLGHHKEGVRHASLVGLHSALDSKFERDDLAHIIANLVVPSLLVLIEQQPPLQNEVLPDVDPGRCHALALKIFGACGNNGVAVGVPRL